MVVFSSLSVFHILASQMWLLPWVSTTHNKYFRVVSSFNRRQLIDDILPFCVNRGSTSWSVVSACENNSASSTDERMFGQSAFHTYVKWICVVNNASQHGRHAKQRVKALAFCLSNKKHCSVLRSNPQGFGLFCFFPRIAISLLLRFLFCHWGEITSSPGFILRKRTNSMMSSLFRHILNNLSWPHQNPHLQRRCYICDLR